MEKFCGKCGTELTNGVCPKCGQNESKNADDYERKIIRFFVSENEKMVAVLGKNYSEEYIKKGNSSSGFAVVSDKRLYSFGRNYDLCNNIFGRKEPKKHRQSKIIDLKDVTGIENGVYHVGIWRIMTIVHFVLMIIGILCSMLCFVEMPPGVNPLLYEEATTVLKVAYVMSRCTPILFIGAIIYLIVSKKTKFHMLTVRYNGGEIAFDMAFFSKNEIDFFKRQLHLAKDKATENGIENSTKEETVSSVIPSIPHNSKTNELVQLADLLSKGAITQEEYEKMKRELI